jgi:hypothetical protein
MYSRLYPYCKKINLENENDGCTTPFHNNKKKREKKMFNNIIIHIKKIVREKRKDIKRYK